MGILDTATCQILGKNWQRRLKHWKDTVITSNNQQARLNVCMKLWKLILLRSIFLLTMIKMN